jgi:hypothetical protein
MPSTGSYQGNFIGMIPTLSLIIYALYANFKLGSSATSKQGVLKVNLK